MQMNTYCLMVHINKARIQTSDGENTCIFDEWGWQGINFFNVRLSPWRHSYGSKEDKVGVRLQATRRTDDHIVSIKDILQHVQKGMLTITCGGLLCGSHC